MPKKVRQSELYQKMTLGTCPKQQSDFSGQFIKAALAHAQKGGAVSTLPKLTLGTCLIQQCDFSMQFIKYMLKFSNFASCLDFS